MSQDLPVPRQNDRSDGPAVLEWGPDEPAAPSSGRFGRTLAGLGRDRRLPPVLAGLGAVAAMASLVGEWLVMTVPDSGPGADTVLRVPGNVSEVGGFGAGYLVGLLVLSAVVVLALAGTPAVRPNARLAGLALTGALLALLVATAFSLDEPSQRTLFYSPEDGFQVEYGRGLVMAFVGCLLLVAALQLSGQATEAPTDSPGWRWPGRRDRPQPDDDELPAPADLTVGPAVPFARPEPPA